MRIENGLLMFFPSGESAVNFLAMFFHVEDKRGTDISIRRTDKRGRINKNRSTFLLFYTLYYFLRAISNLLLKFVN